MLWNTDVSLHLGSGGSAANREKQPEDKERMAAASMYEIDPPVRDDLARRTQHINPRQILKIPIHVGCTVAFLARIGPVDRARTRVDAVVPEVVEQLLFDVSAKARPHLCRITEGHAQALCMPANGSRISGEPSLKSFDESTRAGANQHEPPDPEREARRIEGGEAGDGLVQGSSVCSRLLDGVITLGQCGWLGHEGPRRPRR